MRASCSTPAITSWTAKILKSQQHRSSFAFPKTKAFVACRDEEEDDGSSFARPNKNIPNEELHFSEKWFHGKLTKGREEAEQLLKMYSYLGKPCGKYQLLTFSWCKPLVGDGTFLVRASVTFVGEYSLSFWRSGQVNHCRIRSKQDKQQTKYYLIDGKYFDSLYSLITHYR